MNYNYLIYGCGGHARSVADVILFNNKESKISFVDKNAKVNERIFDFPVLNQVSESSTKDYNIHFAIGDNNKRRELFYEPAVSILSIDAYIGKNAQIGNGSFVGHNVFIGPEVMIGKSTIINTGSIIEHEVIIGDFCHIAPNSTICGKVSIGNNVFIGAGAIIKDKIFITNDVVIGSGAVVVNDILSSGIYIGCPAKEKK